MHKLEVGRLYHPGRRSWPEGTHYNYRSGGHEWLISFPRPSMEEIFAVRKARAEFALGLERDILFLFFRFGDRLWSDASYTYWLMPENQRSLPEAEATENTRARLNVILIDATSGLIKALRAVTFSPEFTGALHEAIRIQAENPVTPAEYEAALSDVYGRWTTGMLLARAVAQCQGGE